MIIDDDNDSQPNYRQQPPRRRRERRRAPERTPDYEPIISPEQQARNRDHVKALLADLAAGRTPEPQEAVNEPLPLDESDETF